MIGIHGNTQAADILNTYFETAINLLEINESRFILTDRASFTNSVENSIKNYESNLSTIITIGNVHIKTPFKFSEVTYEEIVKEVNDLNIKKPGTFSIIPKTERRVWNL